ncbi:MAG: hydroxymethylbilane synthase [Planctomycetota bacterium]|jgi:hydroxymethylbilane synthase
MRLLLGTRGSRLARTQSGHVADLLRAEGHDVELEIIQTRGDVEQGRPVPELGGKGLFTAELEAALLSRRVHLAVHSLKDLPTEDAEGLVVAAVPPREDSRDALVSRGPTLQELPAGARVGTASLRRRALLKRRRPDLEVVDLRGNVDTRVRKVHEGELDAVVLAAAGVHRLGRADVIVEYLDFLPAPAQGALAVQACGDRDEVLAALRPLHDEETARCTRAERELLHVLEGGCSVPVGALATVAGAPPHLALRGIVAAPDGSRALEAAAEGEDPEALGREVAAQLRAQGAEEILNA